jgi:hypothetical protein
MGVCPAGMTPDPEEGEFSLDINGLRGQPKTAHPMKTFKRGVCTASGLFRLTHSEKFSDEGLGDIVDHLPGQDKLPSENA